MPKQKKIRLDELMVRQGLAADAGEALRLVLAHQVKVGDEYLHACVDGPDFDGHLVDYDDAMRRGVKEAVGTLIVEFGSYGKAPLVEPATLEDMAARYAKEG